MGVKPMGLNIATSQEIPKGQVNIHNADLVKNFWGNLNWRRVHAAMDLTQYDRTPV